MARINDHYLKLKAGYLFPEIERRVRAFQEANPDAELIKLGIGDVTEPLPPAVVDALHRAVDEMARRETFRGYGPPFGYPWLREAIAHHDYTDRGCDVRPDEIFISDASKCDTGNFLDVLAAGGDGGDGGNVVAVPDPVYPVYVDTNVMAGNTGPARDGGEYDGLVYLRADERNGFVPDLPDRHVDVIYLCFPNNPTGSVADHQTLRRWVDYAREHDALILFDAAYEAYVSDPELPRSIYEIEGARDVAVEFRSFSKNAGFTGTRCAFTVVPGSVTGRAADGQRVPLHRLWSRRQSTRFNGVAYLVQRAAEAVYQPEGREQCRQLVAFYLENARVLREALSRQGMRVFGGVHAPYVWARTPEGESSWSFFDRLLNEAHLVCTPGSGFGAAGEGYVRFSAFNSRENVERAVDRLGSRLAV